MPAGLDPRLRGERGLRPLPVCEIGGFSGPNPPIFPTPRKKDSAPAQGVELKTAKIKTALSPWEKILPHNALALTEGDLETSELRMSGRWSAWLWPLRDWERIPRPVEQAPLLGEGVCDPSLLRGEANGQGMASGE
jgi:hypothetical protein